MKTEFKVGDKVRCINGFSSHGLIEEKIYEISSLDVWGNPRVFNEKGEEFTYASNRFEIVEKPQPHTVSEHVAAAELLLNKKVLRLSADYKEEHEYDQIKIFYQGDDRDSIAYWVQEHLRVNDFCVALCNSHYKNMIPYQLLILPPGYIEVSLDDKNTAKVYKDKIEMGSKTFSIDIIKKNG